MRAVLFCQLSGQLIESCGQLSSLISSLKLHNAYLLSQDTAITWVESEEIAASIVLKGIDWVKWLVFLIANNFNSFLKHLNCHLGKIQLNDSLSATYSFGGNVTSRFLQILVSDVQSGIRIAEAVRKTYLKSDVLISFKKLAILLRYPSRTMAIDGYQLLDEMFHCDDGIRGIDLVAISGHCILECQWHSDSTIDRLSREPQSLKGTRDYNKI